MALDLSYAVLDDVSITNTETSIAVDGGTTSLPTLTDAGIYSVFIDAVATMVKGDEYLLKVYEKCGSSAATKRVIMQMRIYNAQSEPTVLPGLVLGIGWDVTLQRISASSRNHYTRIARVS